MRVVIRPQQLLGFPLEPFDRCLCRRQVCASRLLVRRDRPAFASIVGTKNCPRLGLRKLVGRNSKVREDSVDLRLDSALAFRAALPHELRCDDVSQHEHREAGEDLELWVSSSLRESGVDVSRRRSEFTSGAVQPETSVTLRPMT